MGAGGGRANAEGESPPLWPAAVAVNRRLASWGVNMARFGVMPGEECSEMQPLKLLDRNRR